MAISYLSYFPFWFVGLDLGSDCFSSRSLHTCFLSIKIVSINSLVWFIGPKSAFTVATPVAGESNGTIKFTNVITNSGGHYNTTSGQFQAEYPGIYAFFLHLYKNAGATFARCSLRMNDYYVMHAESMVNSDISYCSFESSNSVIL